MWPWSTMPYSSTGIFVEIAQNTLNGSKLYILYFMPKIILANLHPLPNKTDERLLLSRTNKDFSNSAALCFMETWLNDASALNLPCWEVVFRCNCVKVDVLFRSRNASHSIHHKRFVRSFSWVFTFHRTPTQDQLCRNSLIRLQRQNKNTQTLF